VRLVFAIKALSTLGGGAERVFAEVVNGLNERGHEIAVLTFEPSDAGSFYSINKSIQRLRLGRGAVSKAQQLLLLPNARSAIAAFAPDVVVGFMPSCYVPLGAALSLSGIPFIASEHNVPARYARSRWRWLSILAASAYSARFTAVSEQMRAAYPAVVRRKMSVLPNPVSVAADGRADVRGTGPARHMIAVGRLHEQKDHLTLIRAFARLAHDFPIWQLRILGDGSEREVLAAEIDRLRLDERVLLVGTVRDIGAEYRSAQLYVVPSRYESLGLATVEALAYGLPAVGFADCPGTNELIVPGRNGVLVAPGADRVVALADALRPLMADTDLRLSLTTGSAPIPEGNQIASVLDRWEELLRAHSHHSAVN
jgi:glycosyltransferase involved in cell wall biosynthesis